MPTPAWKTSGDTARLYHGCTATNLDSIIRNRINLGRCDPYSDFGKGFYLTTMRRQAEKFARTKALFQHDYPALLTFDVPWESLAGLRSIAFVVPHDDAGRYWSLVQHCRSGNEHLDPPLRWYDWAMGPVAHRWDEANKKIYQGYDQLSIHTKAAVDVFNDLMAQGKPAFDYTVLK